MESVPNRPDFILLGAAKAGTTALFSALSTHPGVFCSPRKEPRYFAYAGSTPTFPGPGGMRSARKVVWSTDAYAALFARCPAEAIAGEASTEYLSSERAPEVACQYVPHARLIAVLRHPVDRAYSQYLHFRHRGDEALTFEAAWEAEDWRIAQGWRPAAHYRARGFYGRALTRWLKVFPREQLLVLFYEDWLKRPEYVLDLVWRHLGVEPLSRPTVRRENVSSRRPRWRWLNNRMAEDNGLRRLAQRWLPLATRDAITRSIAGVNLTSGPRLDRDLRARLATVYHEDLREVEALTGRDLSAWRS